MCFDDNFVEIEMIYVLINQFAFVFQNQSWKELINHLLMLQQKLDA